MSNILPTKNNKKSNLALLREQRNLTQVQLADVLGITVKTYRDYELGKQLPKTDLLIEISDFFNVSTDYILGRSDCTSVENEYIKQKTGLDENAINVLSSWCKYENDMIHGTDVLDDDGNVFLKGLPQNIHYRATATINELFKAKMSFEFLLRSVQDLFHVSYKYPVYHTGDSEIIDDNGIKVLYPQCVVPTNNWDNLDNDTPLLTLTNDTNKPFDNYSIALTNDFFEGVAIQKINKYLREIRDELTNQ